MEGWPRFAGHLGFPMPRSKLAPLADVLQSPEASDAINHFHHPCTSLVCGSCEGNRSAIFSDSQRSTIIDRAFHCSATSAWRSNIVNQIHDFAPGPQRTSTVEA